jgi:hypothetical protein
MSQLVLKSKVLFPKINTHSLITAYNNCVVFSNKMQKICISWH